LSASHRMADMSVKRKASEQQPSEGEGAIDRIVAAQAEASTAWEEPVQAERAGTRRPRDPTFSGWCLTDGCRFRFTAPELRQSAGARANPGLFQRSVLAVDVYEAP